MQHTEDARHVAIWEALLFPLSFNAVKASIETLGIGAIEGSWCKRRGCVPGWPDLEVIYLGRAFHVAIKATPAQLSPTLRDCHLRITAWGGTVGVCRSVNETKKFLHADGIPMRAEVSA